MNWGNTFGRRKRIQYNNVLRRLIGQPMAFVLALMTSVKLNRIDGVTSNLICLKYLSGNSFISNSRRKI